MILLPISRHSPVLVRFCPLPRRAEDRALSTAANQAGPTAPVARNTWPALTANDLMPASSADKGRRRGMCRTGMQLNWRPLADFRKRMRAYAVQARLAPGQSATMCTTLLRTRRGAVRWRRRTNSAPVGALAG